MKIVRLKAKRDYPTRMGHPWIFSGAVDSVSREPAPGETVLVTDAAGEALGMGAWSPASQIRVRMWHTQAQAPADEAFFRDRLASALALRAGMAERFATDALRLVNAEADGLPGVTVDRYGETLVGQFTTAGAEAQKPLLVRLLMELTGAAGFYERSDGESRKHEGLELATGLLAGTEPPERIALHEAGVVYEVDVRGGHKTGFYLDQRENRRLIAAYAAGRTVLNAFSYTGGFGVAAQVAGAQAVTHIDLSAPALAIARRNAALNPGADSCQLDFVQGNVFQELRALRDRARSFGLVVLDPPKFAETRSQT
ncbi:MAG: class I SAM-dependent rRNA methyltransferase, partial [Candidatus Spyradenecus sp.]